MQFRPLTESESVPWGRRDRWVVTLAGAEGAALEKKFGPAVAARLIYFRSDPSMKKTPFFFCGDAAALADIQACAKAEAEKAVTP
jgi:hypothetical protein